MDDNQFIEQEESIKTSEEVNEESEPIYTAILIELVDGNLRFSYQLPSEEYIHVAELSKLIDSIVSGRCIMRLVESIKYNPDIANVSQQILNSITQKLILQSKDIPIVSPSSVFTRLANIPLPINNQLPDIDDNLQDNEEDE